MLQAIHGWQTGGRRVVLAGVVGAALIGLACSPPEQGASDNAVQKPGQQERGRTTGRIDTATLTDSGKWLYHVHYGDIVLAPDGHTLLVSVPMPGPTGAVAKPTMQLVAYDLDTTKMTPLEAYDVLRIQFSLDGKLAWLLTDQGTALRYLEIATGQVTHRASLQQTFTTLDRTPDGKYVVVANLPRNDWEEALFNEGTCKVSVAINDGAATVDRCAVAILDATKPTGRRNWTTPEPVRDLDFSPFRNEIVLTWSEFGKFGPRATLAFYQPDLTEPVGLATAPNCGDELVFASAYGKALLAPTHCAKDPISVFDLDSRTYIDTLPGFGPVAIVGDQAIGFTTRATLPPGTGHLQESKFGLIQVDLNTLQWQIHDWGEFAPAYLAAPDAQHLLVWQDQWDAPARLTRIRVADWKEMPLQNPTVRMQGYLWRPDGDTAVVISEGLLFRLRVSTLEVEHLPLMVAPELLQQRPTGSEILLGESDEARFYKYNVDTRAQSEWAVSLGAMVSSSLSMAPLPTPGWDDLTVTDLTVMNPTAKPADKCTPEINGGQLDRLTLQREINGQWQTVGTFAFDFMDLFNLDFCAGYAPYALDKAAEGGVVWLGGKTTRLFANDRIQSGDRILVTPLGDKTVMRFSLANTRTQVVPVQPVEFAPVTGKDGEVVLLVP